MLLSFRDRGFLYGDAVCDTTRTFVHRLFKLPDHIERLYCSLGYVRIAPRISPAEMCAITEEEFERNRHLLGPEDDCRVSQRISRGLLHPDGEQATEDGPTVIVECTPLPFRQRAHLYTDGIRVNVPSMQWTPPEAPASRAGTTNYLDMMIADQETTSLDPDAWAVLFDIHGNLADGRLATPRAHHVLPGISRQTVLELAAPLGIPCDETVLDLYDAYNADEAFLTSTSLCICPVRSINGSRIGSEQVFGTITHRLIEAYVRLVDCDFVAQYRRQLDGGGRRMSCH
ncbi:MAG: aminotransferase class IV [Geminicoccaceae bacterium]